MMPSEAVTADLVLLAWKSLEISTLTADTAEFN